MCMYANLTTFFLIQCRHVVNNKILLFKVKLYDDLVNNEMLLSLQDESAPGDKQCKPEAAQGTYSTSAVSGSQEVLYINGNGTYSYHSYRGLGGGLLNLNDASSSGEFLLYLMFLCVHLRMLYSLIRRE